MLSLRFAVVDELLGAESVEAEVAVEEAGAAAAGGSTMGEGESDWW